MCPRKKENIINQTHVDGFWLFLESNILKFNVNGSIQFLKEKVKKHFDTTLTPENKDPDYLVTEIPYSMRPDQLKEFLNEIKQHLDKTIFLAYSNSNVQQFYIKLFKLPTTYLRHVIEFFHTNSSLLIELLIENPAIIYFFKKQHEFIRSLWKGIIKNSTYYYPLITKMLQYELIPQEQLKEFVASVSNNIGDSYFGHMNDEKNNELGVLLEKGFIEILGEIAFDRSFPKINNFDWSRENKNLICYYLKNYRFDEGTVNALYDEFNREHYPIQLGISIRELFIQNPSLYEEYEQATELYNVLVPPYFEKS